MSAPAVVLSDEAASTPAVLAGWRVTWRIEMAKLGAQLRIRIVLLACLAVPFVFAASEAGQSSVPGDTIFGRWIHESGFSVALFLLAFCSQWGLPFVAAIVAGDVCAEEDRRGTWSLMLTRSRSRGQVLAGKVLAAGTYVVAGTVILGASSIAAGVLFVGTQPLVGLSGTMLSPRHAFIAAAVSWLTVLAPMLSIVAISVLVSVVSRNGWVGVVLPVIIVLVLAFVSQMSSIDAIRPLLPTTGFDAWHGLVRDTTYTDQIWTSLAVNAVWVSACLGAAAAVFLRRDVVDA